MHMPEGMAIVREAERGEWEAVADLTQAAYAELTPDLRSPFWLGYQASTRATLLGDEGSLRLVVDVHGAVAASVLLCPPDDGVSGRVPNPCPEMRLLAVHPRYRNQRLGGRLIEACEARVREEGYPVITLHTTAFMPTAKAMYERRGYVRAPALDFEPSPGVVVWGYSKELTGEGAALPGCATPPA